MTALADQQRALLDRLFHPDQAWANDALQKLVAPGSTRGLVAYRAHGQALAERALQAAYPVIAEFIGQDNFAPLARLFWRAHPPQCGDLTRWGEALPDWLGTLAALSHEPCLPDLARVEWALHTASGAPDGFIEPRSFERLTQEDPQGLRFRLAPGAIVIESRWPVVSLVQAHREGAPSLAHAAQRLHEGIAECALVWRHGMRPSLMECTPTEATWLEALMAGMPLPDALSAVAHTDFNLGDWLPRAVQRGVVLGVDNATSSTKESP